MVFDNYFFLLPVYRLGEEKYYSAMEADFEKQCSAVWTDDFRQSNPDLVTGWQSSHRDSYGGAWEFNEIMGYIKLYFMGTQVRGEYWGTIPKRKVRTRKKQFEYKTHKLAAEKEIREETNDGILKAVSEYIADCQRELKGRHIDLREFNALKDCLDWTSIVISKNTIPIKRRIKRRLSSGAPQSGVP
ncbi:hypothetical protein [Halopseudomonas oceani]|uniref:hypothetical protein n=1 Tax=Halopseudomonas oceani TaxID=1708783 RepID=UPI002AA7A13D|nr:hypothetical protein [Halopseudomonas oceani]